MYLRLLSIGAVLLSLTTCQCASPHATLRIASSQGVTTFKVEVARTEKNREHGLMERESMPQDHGMIFIFDESAEHPFWMKNTKIPLDIVFFDEDWKVVGCVENLEPMSRRSRSIGKSSRYALEVNAGLVQKKGIAPGDVATFNDVRK